MAITPLATRAERMVVRELCLSDMYNDQDQARMQLAAFHGVVRCKENALANRLIKLRQQAQLSCSSTTHPAHYLSGHAADGEERQVLTLRVSKSQTETYSLAS